MITRGHLRDKVRKELRERLVRGRIAPGTRINESTLSAELGLSRTPLREALLHLESEGLVRSEPARGFVASPLGADEIRELYPILWTLEALAVRAGEPPPAAQLRSINESMSRATADPLKRLRLDLKWHQTLTKGYANRRLHHDIGRLKTLIARYEYAYMREVAHLPRSVKEHEEIADRVEAGNRDKAARRLEEHWRGGMERLLAEFATENAAVE